MLSTPAEVRLIREAWRWCVLAAIALALGGCSLGPRYRRPSIPAPAALGPPAAAAIPQGWPSADWWHGFHSAELSRLIASGRAANDDLAAAIARVREAEAQVTVSTAPLLPAADASADGSRQRVISPNTGAGTLYNEFAAGLNATYELDFWGENRAIRSAALASADASRYDRQTVELTVMSGIADTYFSVLALRDRLRIARESRQRPADSRGPEDR